MRLSARNHVFDPNAESPRGAKGLMQIMPGTASYIAGRADLRSREGQKILLDPHYNIELGQKYLASLLRDRSVDGDLVSLMIAYNAGPGNLAKWKRALPEARNDLLFIELIPSRENPCLCGACVGELLDLPPARGCADA